MLRKTDPALSDVSEKFCTGTIQVKKEAEIAKLSSFMFDHFVSAMLKQLEVFYFGNNSVETKLCIVELTILVLCV